MASDSQRREQMEGLGLGVCGARKDKKTDGMVTGHTSQTGKKKST